MSTLLDFSESPCRGCKMDLRELQGVVAVPRLFLRKAFLDQFRSVCQVA